MIKNSMAQFSVYIILICLVISGCRTSPPVNPELSAKTAKVFVQSNIDSAKILVDGSFTGRYTPDTITVNSGLRILSLEKEGFISGAAELNLKEGSFQSVTIQMSQAAVQKVVLIEDFANVSCVPCVIPNKILKSLSESYSHQKLLIIKFPLYWPSPNDPFYLANKSHSDARINYYNIINAPTAIVDGILRPVSSDSNKVKERINERLQLVPQFKLIVKDSIFAGTYIVNVEAELLNNSGINFSNLTLHTVIVEKKIEYSTPPGSNGETKFYDVMRAMMPGSAGAPLAGLEQNSKLAFTNSVAINPQWNMNEIEAIVFIQDKQTKEVYQADSTF